MDDRQECVYRSTGVGADDELDSLDRDGINDEEQEQEEEKERRRRSKEKQRTSASQRLLDLQSESQLLSRYLAIKKQDYRQKMQNLRQRRDVLESRELQMKKAMIHYDKYVTENEQRRILAEKKTEDTRDLTKVKDKEIDRLESEMSGLLQRRDELVDKLDKNRVYPEFLAQVMTSASEFPEIRAILQRYDTLTSTYDDLYNKHQKNQEQLKEQKKHLVQMIEGNNDEVVTYNIALSSHQARLDRAHSRVVELESVLGKHDAEEAARISMLGNIVKATDNLYYLLTTTWKSFQGDGRVTETTLQLTRIQEYINDLQALTQNVADSVASKRQSTRSATN